MGPMQQEFAPTTNPERSRVAPLATTAFRRRSTGHRTPGEGDCEPDSGGQRPGSMLLTRQRIPALPWARRVRPKSRPHPCRDAVPEAWKQGTPDPQALLSGLQARAYLSLLGDGSDP